MRKKLLLLVPIVAVLLFVLCPALVPDREEATADRFRADRAELEAAAARIMAEGHAKGISLPDGWREAELYQNGVYTIEFSMGSSGFASETTYWGVNYVPSDSAVGYRGQRWDHWKSQGDGRLYYDPEGDNTCYVKQLDKCWYYYEMHF